MQAKTLAQPVTLVMSTSADQLTAGGKDVAQPVTLVMITSVDQLITAGKDVAQSVTSVMSTDKLIAAGKDARSAGDFSDEYISGLLDTVLPYQLICLCQKNMRICVLIPSKKQLLVTHGRSLSVLFF